jgi:hypothetical protein
LHPNIPARSYTNRIPVEGDQKLKQVKKLLHHLGYHKDFGQEATLKKHMLSLNTEQKPFSCIPKRKKHLSNY